MKKKKKKKSRETASFPRYANITQDCRRKKKRRRVEAKPNQVTIRFFIIVNDRPESFRIVKAEEGTMPTAKG
jgi:hypothetical protein